MQHWSRWMIAGLCCLVASSGEAAELWKGELGLGLVLTTGNTREENLNAKSDFTRDGSIWRVNLHLDSLRSSKERELTAQKLYFSTKGDYKFEDSRYLFVRYSYEDDRFSGFDSQMDLAVGYGQTLVDNERHNLSVDVGPGYRRSSVKDGTTVNEEMLRLAGAYEWKVSDSAAFEQSLSSELGADATITRAVTSLRATVSDRLAMKVSYSVKHQSEVPLGTKKTDTETSVTLVYSF